MIKQLLDPEFVAARTAELKLDLERRAGQLLLAPQPVQADAERLGIGGADLEEAQAVIARLAAHGDFSRQPEDAAWLPRDPLISLVQSALEEYYLHKDAVNLPKPPVAEAGAPQRFVGAIPAVTDESLKDDWIPTETRPFLRQTEETDYLRWGLSFALAKGIKLAQGFAHFPDQPAEPFPLAEKARLILVGDWGSGTPRALLVRDQIKDRLRAPESLDRERHVIHLGDVYYAGRDYEYLRRFGDPWPVANSQRDAIHSWCLNGNHDMFTGGHAFFGFLASDARFERQKGCSYFCLENEHWQIFGLDSAYESEGMRGDTGGLQSPQAEWLAAHRRRAPDKKVMLLTHHQLFSSWEDSSPLLASRLGFLLGQQHPITAWFWGHEHRCAVYEPRLDYNIGYPALIGHGGVPVHGPKQPKKGGVRYHYREYFRDGLEKFQRMGFAVLDLDGGHARVEYWNELGGEPHYSDTIV